MSQDHTVSAKIPANNKAKQKSTEIRLTVTKR